MKFALTIELDVDEAKGEAQITVAVLDKACTYRVARDGLGRYTIAVNGVESPAHETVGWERVPRLVSLAHT